jgi:hypothetical protein
VGRVTVSIEVTTARVKKKNATSAINTFAIVLKFFGYKLIKNIFRKEGDNNSFYLFLRLAFLAFFDVSLAFICFLVLGDLI